MAVEGEVAVVPERELLARPQTARPLASLTVRMIAPSRDGDVVTWRALLPRLGRTWFSPPARTQTDFQCRGIHQVSFSEQGTQDQEKRWPSSCCDVPTSPFTGPTRCAPAAGPSRPILLLFAGLGCL